MLDYKLTRVIDLTIMKQNLEGFPENVLADAHRELAQEIGYELTNEDKEELDRTTQLIDDYLNMKLGYQELKEAVQQQQKEQ
ncbi:hypothetical protein ATL39_0849 [Sinobaca qinghaiensis]|uniref:Uncharacterized protein n=1 Tax=Sinobaca qinghaiensis TaxID=342944 RepID=A0A419V585_9BACL|nr:hypothetical protein [Sinobaca qinghaiensis]RKD75152.1 hypothetical protein ATL39_0849 [Sinobaca qinghaiensis]